MKMYGVVELQLNSFLTSALVGDKWSASNSSCFVPQGKKGPGTQFDKRLGRLQSCSQWYSTKGNTSTPSEN
jgi:hypothetical protein